MADKWLSWVVKGIEVDKPTVNYNGSWVNELKSYMELRVAGNNVEGTYHTNVGAPGGEEKFPIRGFANGDLISFVVNWEKYGSMTAWVGQHTTDDKGGNPKIETLWQLVKNIDEKSEAMNLWGDVMAGRDVFTPKKAGA